MEIVPGVPIVPSNVGGQQCATTALDPATGLRGMWFAVPCEIGGNPNYLGSSSRALRVYLGLAGNLTVSGGSVSGQLCETTSRDFVSIPDTANHAVGLYKKQDGTYYQLGEGLGHGALATLEWVSPELASSILGIAITPISSLPTGQVYYDPYMPEMQLWDVNPADMNGVTSNMTHAEKLNTISSNKQSRLQGSEIRPGGQHVTLGWWDSFWKKLFGGGYSGNQGGNTNPYGGSSPTPVGPNNFPTGYPWFDSGDILVAQYHYVNPWGNVRIHVPSSWWPYTWHHACVVDTTVSSSTQNPWTFVWTIEAINFSQGVQRVPYGRYWVYNRDLKAIHKLYEGTKLWSATYNTSQRNTIKAHLSTWWNLHVGNNYNVPTAKNSWNPNYCSQLVWHGYYDGAWFPAAWNYWQDVDSSGTTNQGIFDIVFPGEIDVDADTSLNWWWP
jgi:hypothetical protein